MQFHQVKRSTALQSKKRVGRGGLRGKTSGRGHKGQKQHGGHGIRPALRDLIKKIPKLRGHGKNRARTVHDSRVRPVVLNIAIIEAAFDANAEVSPATLLEKGLIETYKGKTPAVKLLGSGELTKKLSVVNCQVSTQAKEKIEKAGGTVTG